MTKQNFNQVIRVVKTQVIDILKLCVDCLIILAWLLLASGLLELLQIPLRASRMFPIR